MTLADLSPVANHLWQSTLFAAVAGLLTLTLGRNRARVRHTVWLAASYKFLIPFSLLIALGGQFRWRTAPETTAPSNLSVVIGQVTQPFPDEAFSLPASPPTWSAYSLLPSVLLGIWLCGFLGITFSWWVHWRLIQAAVRAASPIDLSLPIRALASPALIEPGVFGVFRPVLLLPEGIFHRLTPAQLDAVLAHELCHVRHRDNLIAAIHMLVETGFWFHPLVWWIGKRMAAERERACDEEVLRLGSEPRVYAEGILTVCKLYLESRLPCVSGVAGSNLRKRIQIIMTTSLIAPLNPAKKAILSVTAAATFAIPIVIGMSPAPAVQAQSRQDAASASVASAHFEVASVKPCKVEPNTGNQRRREFTTAPGRVDIECITLDRIIYFAYAGIGSMKNPLLNDSPSDPAHVRGGPGWIRSDKFTIVATAPGTSNREVMMGPMLRSLLEERFQLKTRRETEEVSLFALTVAKSGLKIRPLGPGGCTSPDTVQDQSPEEITALNRGPKPICGNFTSTGDGVNRVWHLGGQTLQRFANSTLSGVLEYYVIDKTGVAGTFNIHLEFGLDESVKPGAFGGGRAADPPPPDIEKGPSIFTALEQQLGLKVEKIKGPHEFLVIDHIENPSAN